MHSLTFHAKRFHLGAVAFGKKVVAKVKGMTPARFDLMYAIRITNSGCPLTNRLCGYFLRQDRLRKILGLSPSTVSKLIKRLVQMGWIGQHPPDRCLGVGAHDPAFAECATRPRRQMAGDP